MMELFTTEQINAIMGSAPVLEDPTLDTTEETGEDTTDTGEDTTDTGEDTTDTGEDTTDTGEDTTDTGEDTTDTGTDEPVDIVNDSGKIEIPKIKPTFSGKINFPMVVDLSISFTFNGKAFAGGVLSLLSQTLQGLGFGDFSTFKQENGVMLVEGSGESEGIGFAFMPPPDKNVQPTEAGTEAGLNVDEDGDYVVNTDEGLAVTVKSAPKDPEALAEAVDGDVAVDEDGTTTISGDIQTTDSGAEAPTEIVGKFDPMVVPALEGAKPGVTIEGKPGNEKATVVYSDDTMQTMLPAVEDKPSLDAAVEEIAPEITLKYRHGAIYFVIEGYQMFAVPEFTITIVAKKPAKPVLNILVPGKLVEFINTKGRRQVLHIGIVGADQGDDTTTPDAEESATPDAVAPVDAATVIPGTGTVPEGSEEGDETTAPTDTETTPDTGTAAPAEGDVTTAPTNTEATSDIGTAPAAETDETATPAAGSTTPPTDATTPAVDEAA
jgi:hypothetical protein